MIFFLSVVLNILLYLQFLFCSYLFTILFCSFIYLLLRIYYCICFYMFANVFAFAQICFCAFANVFAFVRICVCKVFQYYYLAILQSILVQTLLCKFAFARLPTYLPLCRFSFARLLILLLSYPAIYFGANFIASFY